MDNEYTFFCVPEDLIFAANQLAMVVAYSEADGMTFETPNCTDADGNLYYARYIWAQKGLIPALQAPLVRPAWDVNEIIDMDAALKAQQSLVFYTANSEEDAPKANPLNLVAIAGCEGIQALSLMGLTTKLDEPMEE